MLGFSNGVSVPSVAVLGSMSETSAERAASGRSDVPSSVGLELSSMGSGSKQESLGVTVVFSFVFVLILVHGRVVFLI